MGNVILTASLAVSCLLSPFQSLAQTGEKRPPHSLTTVADDYYKGDGLGTNDFLVVSDQGRFSFVWQPDAGTPYRNEGAAEVVEKRLALHPTKPDPHKTITGTEPPTLVPVRWGKRLYLLSDQEFLGFCSAVNLGIEPRDDDHGQFYLRVKYGKRALEGIEPPEIDKAEGWPELPKEWQTCLFKEPLEGKITEVVGGKRARVDLGLRDGIRQGMDLWAEGIGTDGLVTVNEVEANSCWVEVMYDIPQKKNFERGRKVLSRIPPQVLVDEAIFIHRFR
jgi:hypothetical protein